MVEVGNTHIIGLVTVVIAIFILLFFSGNFYSFLTGKIDDSICKVSVLDQQIKSTNSKVVCPYVLTHFQEEDDIPRTSGDLNQKLRSYFAESVANCYNIFKDFKFNYYRTCAVCEIVTIDIENFGNIDVGAYLQSMDVRLIDSDILNSVRMMGSMINITDLGRKSENIERSKREFSQSQRFMVSLRNTDRYGNAQRFVGDRIETKPLQLQSYVAIEDISRGTSCTRFINGAQIS